MKRKIRVGSLFSGAGAFEQALGKLNIPYEIIFACDNDKYVKKTYFSNYEIEEEKWHSDIRGLNGSDYKYKVDIVIGGSPCQAFSIAGRRAGLEDTRGTLFYDFARIISECRPKIFIYENVKGLLNHNKGETWRIIREVFETLGYKIYYSIINCRDYGVPQNRERLFVIGFRDKRKKYEFPKKKSLETKMMNYLDHEIQYKYYLSDKGVAFVKNNYRIKKRYTQINGEVSLCQKANQQSNLHGDFIDYTLPPFLQKNKFYKTMVRSKQIAARKECLNLDNEIKVEYENLGVVVIYPSIEQISKHNFVRKLTPRECFRLMGFSEDFKIVVSDQQAYKQSGNSIVVNVLESIIVSLSLHKML
jgi:DNA (cytosine-5)-methyltransferase 1